MLAFSLLIVCLVVGIAVARFAQPPPTLAAGLNWWVVNIALPALVLHLVPTLKFNQDTWFLVVSMWLVFAASWGFFAVVGRTLGWTRGRIGALVLVCGLGNTAFIGYPMIEALRGREGLALAVVADQVGCFVMLAIGGALVSAVYSHSNSRMSARVVAKRIALFPPFVALLVGLIAGTQGGWPPAADAILHRIGDTLVPLALFSVGLQVRVQPARDQLGAALLGLTYKLILAPMIVFALGQAFGVSGLTLAISVLQAAMAPMISAAILAEQNDLDPQAANLLLVLGIVISFATVPLINSLL